MSTEPRRYEQGQFHGLPDKSAHDLVKFLHTRLAVMDMPRARLEEISGLSSSTLKAWWNGDRAITLQNIEAALNSLGYELKPVPVEVKITSTPFHPDGIYKTRSGSTAEIESIRDGYIFGHHRFGKTGYLQLQWTLDGRRVPVAGEDPFDLVPP